jgi:putative flavoprotein involved in K+ transport
MESVGARNVVVVTGPYQRGRVPLLKQALPPDVMQIHSGEYRNPDELPEGAVLVVGSRASGCQIADELIEAGHRTYLSVGRHQRAPRRYCGRDALWWRRERGLLDQTATEVAPQHRLAPPLVTGAHGRPARRSEPLLPRHAQIRCRGGSQRGIAVASKAHTSGVRHPAG